MRHEQSEHQNVANTRENERFELQNVAQNTSEMAASSSKILQIARETDRTGDPQKIPKRVKKQNYPGKSVGKLDNGITHFNVDDNDAVDDGDVDDDGEDKDILRTTRQDRQNKATRDQDFWLRVHSLLPPDTATTADICGELVLTADSGARSMMTVPR